MSETKDVLVFDEFDFKSWQDGKEVIIRGGGKPDEIHYFRSLDVCSIDSHPICYAYEGKIFRTTTSGYIKNF